MNEAENDSRNHSSEIEENDAYKLSSDFIDGQMFLSIYNPEDLAALVSSQPKFEGPTRGVSRNGLRKAKKHISKSIQKNYMNFHLANLRS